MGYNHVCLRIRAWLLAIVVCAASPWACIPGELDLEPPEVDAGSHDASKPDAAKPDVAKPDGRADVSPDVAPDTHLVPDSFVSEAQSIDRNADDVAPERGEGSIATTEAGDVAREAEGGRDVGAPDVACQLTCCPSCAAKYCGDPDGCGQRCNGPCRNSWETCGGGGVAHQCGCTPNCDGKRCGDGDGCQGTCTYCDPPDTCGGGGTPNVCGCRRDCQNKNCHDPDGCGGRCDGPCPNPNETCGGGGQPHVCGCTPNCGGKNCGDADGCVDKCDGPCSAGTCGGGGVPHQCGCMGDCQPGQKNTCANGCRVGLNCNGCAVLPVERTCTPNCTWGACEWPAACATCGNQGC